MADDPEDTEQRDDDDIAFEAWGAPTPSKGVIFFAIEDLAAALTQRH